MKEIAKSKTAAKKITYDGKNLQHIVLQTTRQASDLVGSTLGPNGKMVLIERQENLPPFLTKDGITVFNSMAFSDPTAQAVLEAARDSSAKTNVEAGDGTTTATILAEALIRLGLNYLQKHPHLSAQKVMRELEQAFNKVIIPFIAENSIKVNNDNADDLLRKVALISTNNDVEMTDAVLECFNMVGYNGNITIAETAGTSGFDTERIEGFPIPRGFEDTCGRFVEEFINDKGNYRTVLDQPRFLLYNGKINTLSSLLPAIEKMGSAYDVAMQTGQKFSPNVVIVAHHFSEDVLASLAVNFKQPNSLNIIPLKTVITQQANSPYHFLLDMAAFTGATVFDPLSKPIESMELEDLGGAMETLEYYRYKSVILGKPDEFLVITRSEELEKQAEQAESSLDAELLRERLAILTGGIARLKVKGSSEAELKEKRHRVEDAVAAIKGAMKYGVLPGCAKTLISLAELIETNTELSDAVREIMPLAFRDPFIRIMTNGGHNKDEIVDVYDKVLFNKIYVKPKNLLERIMIKLGRSKEFVREAQPFWNTYDAMHFRYGNGIEIGVVDSASAVIMSIKNSLSVAKMLMGLSGIVVFQRDAEIEASEAKNFYAEEAAIQDALKNAEREKFEPPY